MPLNKNFTRRIELLDQCLRSNRKFTLQNLIDFISDRMVTEFGSGASKRTIQGDINYLKNEKGAPIVKKMDDIGWIYSYDDVNFSIKNLPINEEEINNLRTVIEVLRQVKDFNIISEAEDIIDRLENTISTNVPDKRTMIQFDHPSQAMGVELLQDLFEAIKAKSTLKILYKSFVNDNPKELLIHPYLLKEFRNRWFLIARAETDKRISIFVLDRINKIKNCNEPYFENDLFDPNTYYENILGLTRYDGSEIHEIQIKVAKQSAPYLLTKPIHSSQTELKKYKDGSILIGLKLYINYELKSILLSYGDGLEVKKPESLRSEMKLLLNNTLTLYK